MELSYKQEVGVGVLVIAGLVIFTVAMFWLTGRSITAKTVPVKVVFTNAQGLKQGDPVMVSGVKKGRVAAVLLDRVGQVTVRLEVNPDVRPRTDATAELPSPDFFGATFVDYSPGSKDEPLPPTAVIRGKRHETLTDQATGIATRAQELLGNATSLVSDQLSTDLHNTLIATQRGLNVLAEAGAKESPLMRQTTSTLASVERLMVRIDTLLAAPGVANAGRRLDTLSTNLSQLTTHLSHATAALDTLLGKMSRGEGTLGRMATDTTLYTDLHKLSVSLTALLNDLRERPGRYLTVKVF